MKPLTKQKRKVLYFAVLLVFYTQLTYSQTTRGAYWNGYNSSSQSFPMNAAALSSDISSGVLVPQGLGIDNDSRTVWINTNTSSTLDKDTAPFISYTIQTQSITSITFDRFVMNAGAKFGSSKLQLRWNVDNFSSSLGEFSIDGSNYTLTSIDLSSHGAIASGTIEFRVYYYNSPGSDYVFNPSSGTVYPSIDGTPSSYGGNGQSISIWYNAVNETLSRKKQSLNEFKVYPNPVANTLEIINASNISSTINIYSISGKKVLSNIRKDMVNSQIDVSSLNSGIYIVELENELGTTYKKIIKE